MPTFPLVASLVLLLTASGCGLSSSSDSATPAPNKGKYGAGIDLKEVDKTPIPGAQQRAPASVRRAGGSREVVAPPHPGATKPKTRTISRKPIDNGSTGGNAFWYLNTSTPELVIEIDAVSGYKPTPSAIDLLVSRIKEVAPKKKIKVLPIEVIPGGRSKWSTQDVAAFEAQNRDSHNSLASASMYISYVNGEPSSPGPIGVAYSSSAVVVYIKTVRDNATPIVSADAVEKTVLIHEVGHILSLINQTYKSPRNHEDPEHPGHSKNQESVMFWQVDSVGVFSFFGRLNTAPPTAFDADDKADLRDVGAGKLG